MLWAGKGVFVSGCQCMITCFSAPPHWQPYCHANATCHSLLYSMPSTCLFPIVCWAEHAEGAEKASFNEAVLYKSVSILSSAHLIEVLLSNSESPCKSLVESQVFEELQSYLNPGDPPLTPIRFWPPFSTWFWSEIDVFWPLGAIWGHICVKISLKRGPKSGPGWVGFGGGGHPDRSGSVAPLKSCNGREVLPPMFTCFNDRFSEWPFHLPSGAPSVCLPPLFKQAYCPNSALTGVIPDGQAQRVRYSQTARASIANGAIGVPCLLAWLIKLYLRSGLPHTGVLRGFGHSFNDFEQDW